MLAGFFVKKKRHVFLYFPAENFSIDQPAVTRAQESIDFSLEEPFAHPLAVARQTEKWPDVVAICGAGTALVDPTAFEETLVLGDFKEYAWFRHGETWLDVVRCV